MDIELIKARVRRRELIFSSHGEEERMDEGLLAREVIEALLEGEILEHYPDTGRGESCLILGFAGDKPIHVVCGWRGDSVVVITVYTPRMPYFIDPWTRVD